MNELILLFIAATMVCLIGVYGIAEQAHRKIDKLQKLIDKAGWLK